MHLSINKLKFSIPVFTALVLLTSTLAGAAIHPMPLIAAGKPCFVSTGNSVALFDRNWATNWGGADDSWIAVNVGSGYTKLLLHWIPVDRDTFVGYYDGAGNTGSPGNYYIMTSANSTNGQDGSWDTVVTVVNNYYAGRMHSFDFTGKQWVKLRITGPAGSASSPVDFAELEIFDASNGVDDTWFFMGNSITQKGFNNRIIPNFSQNITAAHPGYSPAFICGGHSGATTNDGLTEIVTNLGLVPDAKYWCLEFGTNDAGGIDTATFRANLETIIGKIIAAGHIPILSRIPAHANSYTSAPLIPYNYVIDDLTAKHNLPPGPDLFTWFSNHPEQLVDGTHPDSAGGVAMNALWAQAVSSLYSPTGVGRVGYASANANYINFNVYNDKAHLVTIDAPYAGKVSIYDLSGNLVHSQVVNQGLNTWFTHARGMFFAHLEGAGFSLSRKLILK